MRRGLRPLAVLLVLVAVQGRARADLTASYDGQLVATRPAATAPAAGTLSQSGTLLSGTVAVTLDDPSLTGAYLGRGKASAEHFRFAAASAGGARLTWRGQVTADGVSGKVRLRSATARLTGTLTFTRRSTTGGGTSCDAVFQQNQAFFVDQVMGTVLVPICANCHVPGGLAEATRLRVDAADPLATARSVSGLVDPLDPAASRILNKPTARLPHGGGQQIVPGGSEEQTLRQWVDLVAQARCSSGGGGGGGTGAELFAGNCAACHGADAAGTAGRPDIRCTVTSRIFDAVRRGRGAGLMPAFASGVLADAEVERIVGFLGGLCSGTPADRFASNCVTCHGPTGGGGRNADGVVGPNMRCQSTHDFLEKVSLGSDAMPAFPELDPTEITAIATYVQVAFCPLGG